MTPTIAQSQQPPNSAQKQAQKKADKRSKKQSKFSRRDQKAYEQKRWGVRITPENAWTIFEPQERFKKSRPPARTVTFRGRQWKGHAGVWEPVHPGNQ